MKTKTQLNSQHNSFDEAVEKGLTLEDSSKGHNTFILLSPKTENDKYARCVIGSTKGVIRRSHSNKWRLIWSYGG